jgi:hypothetical protein
VYRLIRWVVQARADARDGTTAGAGMPYQPSARPPHRRHRAPRATIGGIDIHESNGRPRTNRKILSEYYASILGLGTQNEVY